jgi:oligopeptide transport system substrate-binding protein
MDDAAIIPLYYQENCRLIQPEVRNLDINAMEYRDLKKVYFEINEIKTIK